MEESSTFSNFVQIESNHFTQHNRIIFIKNNPISILSTGDTGHEFRSTADIPSRPRWKAKWKQKNENWMERERVQPFLFLLNKIASSHQLVIVAEMFLNV